MGYTGELMVSYKYDAWGKVTATNEAGNSIGTTLISRNPYLYRGYRYDRETGLYYLNSRYYDPETGRFINADGLVSTGQGVLGNNMFAYCLNNASSKIDIDGRSASDTCCVNEADMGGWRYNYGGGYAYYPGMHTSKYFGFGGLFSYFFVPQPAEVDVVIVVEECAPELTYVESIHYDNESDNIQKSDDKIRSENKTPKNNQRQNKQINDVDKELKLSKNQRRKLHEEISHYGYDFKQILEIAKQIQNEYK